MSSHPLPSTKTWSRRIVGAAAVLLTAATSATVIPPQAAHGAGPGLTLFGEQSLNFHLQSGSADSSFDRYKLRIPPQETAISHVVVDYNPDRWDGKLDAENIELRYRKKRRGRERVFKLKELNVDPNSGIVSLIPEEPIPAGERVEVVFHNVINPSNGGFFKFACKIAIPGDRAERFRNLGNWVIDID